MTRTLCVQCLCVCVCITIRLTLEANSSVTKSRKVHGLKIRLATKLSDIMMVITIISSIFKFVNWNLHKYEHYHVVWLVNDRNLTAACSSTATACYRRTGHVSAYVFNFTLLNMVDVKSKNKVFVMKKNQTCCIRAQKYCAAPDTTMTTHAHTKAHIHTQKHTYTLTPSRWWSQTSKY